MLKKFIAAFWRTTPATLRRIIVRATQRKFTVSVAAIVTDDTGKVLLLDHVLRPASGWGIPGGFIKHGEQPAEAVKRELFEETNLELKDVQMIRVRTIGRHVEIIFRAAASGTAIVKSREIHALGWFKIDEMPENISRIQKSFIKDSIEK